MPFSSLEKTSDGNNIVPGEQYTSSDLEAGRYRPQSSRETAADDTDRELSGVFKILAAAERTSSTEMLIMHH